MPRVSVIIPVHNTARFLDECLGSVFRQTLPQHLIEVIAIDDGSTDDSLQTLHRLAEGRPNVTVMHQDASGNAARPRNVGIETSKGEYLFFLDSDDYLDSDALAGLVGLADETGSGIVLPRIAGFGTTDARASASVKRTRKAVDFVHTGAFRTAHPGKLYRASLVRDGDIRFPTEFRIGEDVPFTLTVGLRSPHVSMLGDKPYYFLRKRDDNTSLRQRGQTVEEVLVKNALVIRTIQRECPDPEKRIILLQHRLLAKGGLWRAFTHPRIEQWDEHSRRAAFARAHRMLISAWRPDYRRGGSLHAYLMTTLIWAGDYDGAMQVSREIAAGGEIKTRRGLFRSGPPRYVSSTGTVVHNAVDERSLLQAARDSRAGAVRSRSGIAKYAAMLQPRNS